MIIITFFVFFQCRVQGRIKAALTHCTILWHISVLHESLSWTSLRMVQKHWCIVKRCPEHDITLAVTSHYVNFVGLLAILHYECL